MKFRILLFLLPLLSGSCAFHTGMMTGNASLSADNFKIIRQAHGYAYTTHVLGIGGNGKSGLVAEARNNLYQNYPLKPGQALANVTVDFKRTWAFIFFTTQVYITADIVDFSLNRSSTEDSVQSADPTLRSEGKEIDALDAVTSKDGYHLNDEVLFKKNFRTYTGKIIGFKGQEALIEYAGENGEKATVFRGLEFIRKKNR